MLLFPPSDVRTLPKGYKVVHIPEPITKVAYCRCGGSTRERRKRLITTLRIRGAVANEEWGCRKE
jgi:hypothetical protein